MTQHAESATSTNLEPSPAHVPALTGPDRNRLRRTPGVSRPKADSGHTRPRICPGAAGIEVDDETGPQTLAGAGEECLLCSEAMEQGEVYVFLRFDGTAGIAHQDCVQEVTEQHASRRSDRAGAPPQLEPAVP